MLPLQVHLVKLFNGLLISQIKKNFNKKRPIKLKVLIRFLSRIWVVENSVNFPFQSRSSL